LIIESVLPSILQLANGPWCVIQGFAQRFVLLGIKRREEMWWSKGTGAI
jgi:hypothetical protein